MKLFRFLIVVLFIPPVYADDLPGSWEPPSYTASTPLNFAQAKARIQAVDSNELLGENINPSTGSLSFNVTDVLLKGNGPDVSISRAFSPSSNARMAQRVLWQQDFVDWDLDIPKLVSRNFPLSSSNVNSPGSFWTVTGSQPYSRCTNFGAQPYNWNPNMPNKQWGGVYLKIPGEGAKYLLKRKSVDNFSFPGTASEYPIVTSDFWIFKCLNSIKNGAIGEAFLAISPAGEKYWFDWLVIKKIPAYEENQYTIYTTYIYPTRVEDRFGNYVTYEWTGDNLKRIISSDGRNLSIIYENNVDDTSRISKIISNPGTSHEKSITYSYAWVPRLFNHTLSSVSLPDGSKWSYSLSGLSHMCDTSYAPDPGNVVIVCDVETDQGNPVSSLKEYSGFLVSPTGFKASYKMRNTWKAGAGAAPCNSSTFFDMCGMTVQSIVSKSYSGVGVIEGNYRYLYCTDVGVDSRPIFMGVCPKFVSGSFSVMAEINPRGETNLFFTKAVGRSSVNTDMGESVRGLGNVIREDKNVSLSLPINTLPGAPHIMTFSAQPNLVSASKSTIFTYRLISNEFSDQVGIAPQINNENYTTRFFYEIDFPKEKVITNLNNINYIWQVDSFDKYARPVQITRNMN